MGTYFIRIFFKKSFSEIIYSLRIHQQYQYCSVPSLSSSCSFSLLLHPTSSNCHPLTLTPSTPSYPHAHFYPYPRLVVRFTLIFLTIEYKLSMYNGLFVQTREDPPLIKKEVYYMTIYILRPEKTRIDPHRPAKTREDPQRPARTRKTRIDPQRPSRPA